MLSGGLPRHNPFLPSVPYTVRRTDRKMHLHRRAAALDTAGKDRGFLHPPGQELDKSLVHDIGMKELVHTLPYVVIPSGKKTQFGTAVKGGDAAKRRRFRGAPNLKASSLRVRHLKRRSVHSSIPVASRTEHYTCSPARTNERTPLLPDRGRSQQQARHVTLCV